MYFLPLLGSLSTSFQRKNIRSLSPTPWHLSLTLKGAQLLGELPILPYVSFLLPTAPCNPETITANMDIDTHSDSEFEGIGMPVTPVVIDPDSVTTNSLQALQSEDQR